jgi:hypothetical protein
MLEMLLGMFGNWISSAFTRAVPKDFGWFLCLWHNLGAKMSLGITEPVCKILRSNVHTDSKHAPKTSPRMESVWMQNNELPTKNFGRIEE